MDATTQALVEFWRRAEPARLTPNAVLACKRRLIDTIGCALLAYDAPLCQMARRMALRHTGNPAATIWGTTAQVAPEAAAFANGVMLRFSDMSDMYRGKSGGHPSDVMAAILAVAETVEADGPAVINAMALAYDVYCSFCDAVDINSLGWDQPVYSILASVLGAGKLLRLTDVQMENAIALALAPNMALYQTRQGELSNWKGCAGANASRNAVFAAYLAQEGFTGPTSVFEGKGGLWDAVGRFAWLLPDDNAKQRWIERTHFKCFPICYHGQTAVWAALDARPQLGDQEIAKIELETYKSAVQIMASDRSRWSPDNHETADHSLPFVIISALLYGEVTDASFVPARLSDGRIKDLMQKVEVRESADCTARTPEAAPCRMTITTKAGAQIKTEVLYPKGHAMNTLSDAEIDLKFSQMSRNFGAPEQGAALLAELRRLDEVKDIRQLLAGIARAASSADRKAERKINAAH